MIARTTAIPIRISTFGGSSQIVTWMTADYGKISTVIKGALRPRRTGAGQYDLGYVCELLFYEREYQGLHTFRDCTALQYHPRIRGHWRATAALSYTCLLAGCASFPAVQNQRAYAQLRVALDALEPTAPLEHLLLWFELQMLALHGTAPQLQQCTTCRCPPAEPYLLAARAGGLICHGCNAARHFETQTLSPTALLLLQQLQRLARPFPPTHTTTSSPLPDEAHRGLRDFTSLWLDVPPHARTIAYQMTRMHLPPPRQLSD